MGQLDQGAQQAASSSEELAATSEEMNSQAAQLQETIGFFKLGSSSGTARPDQVGAVKGNTARKIETAAVTNHSHAEKPVVAPKPKPALKPKPAPVKQQQTQEHVVESRTITPHKIVPDDNAVKVEPVHHQKAGYSVDKPVEQRSKSAEVSINEKDFEGF